MATSKQKNISELNSILKKFAIDGDPVWLAIILFVRNLVQQLTVFTPEKKAEIQHSLFREFEKKDFSAQALENVVTMLNEFLLQTTETEMLREALATEKESSARVLDEISSVFETLRGTSSKQEQRFDEIQEQTVDVIQSNKDKREIVGQFKGLFQGMVAEFKQEAEQMEARARQLEHTANYDPLLTSLHNRRAFEVQLNNAVAQAGPQAPPLSMIMVDVDHFKKVNDTYGHQAGDDVLRQLAHVVESQAVQFDGFPARYGGEELVIIGQGLALKKALIKAEALRADVESYAFVISKNGSSSTDTIYCTISVGVAELKPGWEGSDLVRAADMALYRAKKHGRNAVVGYTMDQV